MGADAVDYEAGGGRCEDALHIFQSCYPNRPPLWIRDVGSAPPPPPPGTGEVP